MNSFLLTAGILAVAAYLSYGSNSCTRTPIQKVTVNDTVKAFIEKKLGNAPSQYKPEVGDKISFYIKYSGGKSVMLIKLERNGKETYYDALMKDSSPELIYEVEDINYNVLLNQCANLSTEDNNDEPKANETEKDPEAFVKP
ncbi:hypothetical protein Q1695_015922 [Nippostrongylus brasiliensis]|nr:hypothetical protein Q1695_015922 [Nippostrongylus brasiliensis]